MALDFAVREHGWNAVVAALALFSDPDDDLRHHAGAILRQWLGRRAASAGRPSEHDLDRIRRSLNRANAAPDLARLVRFHAGL
jgi:hypothetical protein